MSSFVPPAAFGTFRVLHQIGSGVLGPVFRTYDPQRDRLVAVKAFRLDIVPEQVARLAESLRRLASTPFDHPNLVVTLDAGLEGTTAYLASEYVTAETLDVALRHLAPAPLERVVPMLSLMADAIDAAWAAGVGHGALHPRDVFVDNNEVRVGGFGVVPALESIHIKTPVRRPYAAPERVAGEDWDIRADVYALGAIAHELLTRRRPAGPGEQDGALTPGTSAEQRVLIRRVLAAALAERPEHRFGSARAFADALGAIVRGEPIEGLPEGAPTPTVPDDLGELSQAGPTTESQAPPSDDSGLSEVPGETAEFQPSDVADDVGTVEPAVTETEANAVTSAEWPPESSPGEPALDAESAPGPPEKPTWAESDRPPVVASSPVMVPTFGHVEPPAPARFPWPAVVAVFVAGSMLGTVLGYQWGRHTAVAPGARTASAAQPADTDVPVRSGAPARGAEKTVTASTPAGRAAVTGPGRIQVRSTPAGAMVLVDGHPRGQTPATVNDLALGAHTVDVARPGYVPYSGRVTLSDRRAAQSISVVLRPGKGDGAPSAASTPAGVAGRSTSSRGSIYVDSRPRGARVMIDGRVVGTSPLLVPELPPGDHTVQLDLAGHQPVTKRVALKSGEQGRVAVTLEERNKD